MRKLLFIPLLPLISTVACAQDAESNVPSADGAPARAWVVAPRLKVQETFSDNTSAGGGAKTSDQITEVVPGVRVDGRTARVKMHLDYELRGMLYAQGSHGNQMQNTLNAFGTLEAIENLLFVDASGVISQQTISAFGAQSPSYYSSSANTTETSNFRLSPYLKGRLGGYADYEVRYARTMVRAKSAAASDTDIDQWLGRVGGDTPLAFLGWSVDGNRTQYDYGMGRKSESDQWRGSLNFKADPQLRLSVSAGRESNDFATLTKQSWNTQGYGADWNPTERTQISAFREKRFFGYGHSLSINHRMPKSAIRYSDKRDVAALPTQLATVGMGNIYDLLFSEYASEFPDPVVRAAFVNLLLAIYQIPANTPVTAGFLSSQVSIQRSQDLTFVLQGARNILTLSAVRTQSDRLGTSLGSADDFSLASTIRQQGFNATFSHRLTGLTSLNVMGSRTRSFGSGMATSLETRQNTLSAGISTKLGAKTNGALTARRTEATGTVPYTENAVVGSLAITF